MEELFSGSSSDSEEVCCGVCLNHKALSTQSGHVFAFFNSTSVVWLFGAQSSFDTCKSKVSRCNFALGYSTDDFVLHTNVNDGQEFGAAIYQKVDSNLETGVQLGWAAGNNATAFGLGCVYSLDKDTSLRAKINNTSQIGLGITHRLRDGIKLTLSAMIDGRSFNQGGHKLGIGLDLEA